MKRLSAAVALVAFLGLLGPAGARSEKGNAGGPPKLDVAQSCREAQSIGGDDQKLAYKGCMQDEKDAQEQLARKWSQFKAEDRRNCVEQGISPMPSYVEILTCIEMYNNGAMTFENPALDTHSLGSPPAAAPTPAPASEAPTATPPPPPADGGVRF